MIRLWKKLKEGSVKNANDNNVFLPDSHSWSISKVITIYNSVIVRYTIYMSKLFTKECQKCFWYFDTYIGSKCQRMAALEAAKELGIGEEVKAYYVAKGVKWYHYVPYFMIKDPWFGFKKHFWSRTFLEGNYKPKFNYSDYQQLVLQT